MVNEIVMRWQLHDIRNCMFGDIKAMTFKSKNNNKKLNKNIILHHANENYYICNNYRIKKNQ